MIGLEKETGLTLFNHSVSEPSLTEVGNRFLQKFSVIDAEVTSALDECRSLQTSLASSVKIHNAELSSILQPIRKSLRRFSLENGRCSVVLVDIPPSFDTVQEALSSKLINIGFDAVPATVCPEEYEKEMNDLGFSVFEFALEPMLIWFQEDHPLASQDHIGFGDIKDYPIISSSGAPFDSIQKALVKAFEIERERIKLRKIYFDHTNYGFTYFSLTDFDDCLLFTTSGMREDSFLSARPDLQCKFADDTRLAIRIFVLARQSDELGCRFLEFCKTLL